MKMRKKTMLALLCSMALTAGAWDYPYLTFRNTDGTETSVAVEDLTMTVSSGQLTATNASGTQVFTLSALSKMYFSQTPTSIALTEAETQSPEGEVEAVTPAGVSMGRFASMSEAKKRLSRGIYIVKGKETITKIVIR